MQIHLNLSKQKLKTPTIFNYVLNNSSLFNKELCMAILSANIPINKFKNKIWYTFLKNV